MFSSRSKPEHLERPSLYQVFHTFELAQLFYNPTVSHSVNFQQSTLLVPQYPFYRKGIPHGQPVFLANEEYKAIIHDRDELERKYERHIERLRTKKAKEAIIKSPIPSNPDRCFVCNCIIPPEEHYKEHL